MSRVVQRVCILVLLLLFSSAASAQIESIKMDLIFEFGGTSLFDADGGIGNGLQTIAASNGSYIFFDDPYATPYSTNTSNTILEFSDVTDNSDSGVASATFGDGTIDIKLFAPGTTDLVLHLAGTVDWYNEDEETINGVDGQGVFTLTTEFVDTGTFGTHAEWASGNGKSAVLTSITGANQGGYSLVNYQSDWSSPNVSLFIYADSSAAIPEPATIVLFGLGFLALRRKR
jgi:hypothetical protein